MVEGAGTGYMASSSGLHVCAQLTCILTYTYKTYTHTYTHNIHTHIHTHTHTHTLTHTHIHTHIHTHTHTLEHACMCMH